MIGDNSIYTYYLSYLANADLRGGRLNEAAEVLDEALALAKKHVVRFCEPELLRLLGEVRLAQGQPGAARDCFTSALDLSREQGARLYELRTAVSLARSAKTPSEALSVLERARREFGGVSEFPLLRESALLLNSLTA
jgi:tetratricopeptide (TPR) repeat protein